MHLARYPYSPGTHSGHAVGPSIASTFTQIRKSYSEPRANTLQIARRQDRATGLTCQGCRTPRSVRRGELRKCNNETSNLSKPSEGLRTLGAFQINAILILMANIHHHLYLRFLSFDKSGAPGRRPLLGNKSGKLPSAFGTFRAEGLSGWGSQHLPSTRREPRHGVQDCFPASSSSGKPDVDFGMNGRAVSCNFYSFLDVTVLLFHKTS